MGRHLLLAKSYAIECCLVFVCVLYVRAGLVYALQVHSLWVLKLNDENCNFFYDFENIYMRPGLQKGTSSVKTFVT